MAVNYNSSFNGAQPFSDVGVSVSLTPTVIETWVIPGTSVQKFRAKFSFNQNDYVWVGKNVNPVLPIAGNVSPTNQVEFRPKIRYVQGGDSLNFLTSQTGVEFGISLMQLP